MTYTMCLRESRAQIVVNEMNNGTQIISEPDSDGYVRLSVVIEGSYDILSLYHAGMAAQVQLDKQYRESVR